MEEASARFSPPIAPAKAGKRLQPHLFCHHIHGGTVTSESRIHEVIKPRPESADQRPHSTGETAFRVKPSTILQV